MKRLVLVLTCVGFMAGWSTPAFAIKQFNDQWLKTYAENEPLKTTATEAKCNVCHIQGEDKKKRNPYGEEVVKLLTKKEFPVPRFKTEPDKCKEEIEAAFKKVAEIKAKDGKTYGEKIKAGELPGGDKEGK